MHFRLLKMRLPVFLIRAKAACQTGHVIASIGKDFCDFLAPPSFRTIDDDCPVLGHGLEHMGQRVERRIDGTGHRMRGEVGRLAQVEQRDRVRVEPGKFFGCDMAVCGFAALVIINRITQSNRHVLLPSCSVILGSPR